MSNHVNQVIIQNEMSRNEQNGFQQQNNFQQQQTHQSTPSKESSLPVIMRVDALEVIVNFKKHLVDRWEKNKAKQHLNKIIHYHVQHTFFLRYAAPLFLMDYQEQLQANLAKEGANQTTSSREQGLISTLKVINIDVLSSNGNKQTKSIDVLESYLKKLQEKDQLSLFLEVVVYVLFGETPPQIPSELNERKKNLFHYVSPIIAFLIIFYIHAEKKPLTLDELVTRSGLKSLYKNVGIPGKDKSSSKMENNDSEEDSDEDEMLDEEEASIQQNSQFQSQVGFLGIDGSDEKAKPATQFQDLEKTLLKQKQQQLINYSKDNSMKNEQSSQQRIILNKSSTLNQRNSQQIYQATPLTIQSPNSEQLEYSQNGYYNQQQSGILQKGENFQRGMNLQGIPASNLHNHQHLNERSVGIPYYKQMQGNQMSGKLSNNQQSRRS